MTSKTATRNRPTQSSTVQAAIEYTNQCLLIVQRYIDNDTISEDQLLADCSFISRAHYEDITEERACADLCGYPLCGTQLSKQSKGRFKPAQRYHITGNKVYDISRRRNFCSDGCFRCSEHLAGQICTEPKFMRTLSAANAVITLLRKDVKIKGLPGEEVKLKEEVTVDFLKEDETGDPEAENKKPAESAKLKPKKPEGNDKVSLKGKAKQTVLREEQRVETELKSPYIKDDQFKELKDKFKRMTVKEKNIGVNGVAVHFSQSIKEEDEDSDD